MAGITPLAPPKQPTVHPALQKQPSNIPPTQPLPQGWVPMPSVASQLETDQAKQHIHHLKNLITTRAPQGLLPKQAARTLDIPHIPQSTNYSCGPAAFKAINDYLQGPRKSEEQLCDEMGASPNSG